MKGPTTQQGRVLAIINASNPPPTIRELGEKLGDRGVGTVRGHLSQLKDKGYIEQSRPHAARSYMLTDKALEWLGERRERLSDLDETIARLDDAEEQLRQARCNIETLKRMVFVMASDLFPDKAEARARLLLRKAGIE